MQALYRIDDVIVTNELADGHNEGPVRARWGVDGTGALALVEDYDGSEYRREFLEEIALRAAHQPGLRAFHRGGIPLTIRRASPGVRLDRFLEVNAAQRVRPPQDLCASVARALDDLCGPIEPDIPLSTLVWLGFDGSVAGVPALVPRYASWTSDYAEEFPDGGAADADYAAAVNLYRVLYGRTDAPPGDDLLKQLTSTSFRDLRAVIYGIALVNKVVGDREPQSEIARVLAGLFPRQYAASRALREECAILNRDVPALGGVEPLLPRNADVLRRLDDGPAGFP